METVPFSDRQSPPSTEAGEMVASLSLSRSDLVGTEPEKQDLMATFEDDGMLPALGAPVLPAGVAGSNVFNHASRHQSTDHMLDSNECLSSATSVSGNDLDLEPPLAVGLNSRVLHEAHNIMSRSANQHQSDGSNHERELVATSSANSIVDREVLVMREAAEVSSVSSPTPLGRQRRRSLFERANSMNMPSSAGSSDHDTSHVKRRDRSFGAMGNGLSINSIVRDENSSDRDHRSELGRDKYKTVFRDWLMHVLEKDDQQNAEVRQEGHLRLDTAILSQR